MNRNLLAPALLTPLLLPTPPPAPHTAVWPLGPPRPPLVRGWQPPATPYAAGHRGVDLAAPPGTPVRAAAAGEVTFTGPVGGRGVLTITLPAPEGTTPLRTTYEPVRPLTTTGTQVQPGEVVAVTTDDPASHCAATCLHWGLRQGDTYLNPLTLLPPHLLRRPPSRLLPLDGRPGTGATTGL